MTEEQIIDKIVGGSLVLAGILVLLLIAFIVVYIIGLSKLFKKAGKPGWAAIVPFYNTYVLIEIAGLNWWYFLIAISGSIFTILGISGLATLTWLASAAVNFFVFYNLGKKFKQNPVTYGVLGIFFSGIIAMVLGYSNNMVYDDSVEVTPNGPIDDKKDAKPSSTTTNSSERFCLGCGQKLKPGASFCENCGKKI